MSSLALAAICWYWFTPVPAMCSCMGSWACTAGKPVSTHCPSARPALARAPWSRERRVKRLEAKVCTVQSAMIRLLVRDNPCTPRQSPLRPRAEQVDILDGPGSDHGAAHSHGFVEERTVRHCDR